MMKSSKHISLFFARLFALLTLFVSLAPVGVAAERFAAVEKYQTQQDKETESGDHQEDVPVFNEGVRHASANFDFSFKPDLRKFFSPFVGFYPVAIIRSEKIGKSAAPAPELTYFKTLFRTGIAVNAP